MREREREKEREREREREIQITKCSINRFAILPDVFSVLVCDDQSPPMRWHVRVVENTWSKVQLLKGEIDERLNSMTTQENGQSGTIINLY